MKFVYTLTVLQQLVTLLGEHTSSAFVVESRRFQDHYRECVIKSSTFGSTGNNRGQLFRSTTRTRIQSQPEEYDDGIGDISNRRNIENIGDDDSLADGEDLAKDFYKNLQQRLEDPPDREETRSKRSSPPSEAQRPVGSLFETNDYYEKQENEPPKPKVKYTGRQTGENNYFGSSNRAGGTSNNNNNNNAVREQMMRREFDLVSGATGRTALGLQAGIAISMLVFFLYVGMTGGIVSGDAAVNMDFGGDDSIQFEQIIPVPPDSNDSVWL